MIPDLLVPGSDVTCEDAGREAKAAGLFFQGRPIMI